VTVTSPRPHTLGDSHFFSLSHPLSIWKPSRLVPRTIGTSRPNKFFLAGALLVLAGSLLWADAGWLSNYRKGVAEREKGGCPAAAFYFLEALKERSEPQAGVKLDSVTTVDYLPRLMLADCLCRMGEKDLAEKYLSQGAAEQGLKTSAATALLDSVGKCLGAKAPPVSADRIKVLKRVQDKCGLSEEKDKTLYPWYFDYEVSQEFLKTGEYDAVIQYLYRAIDKKAVPQEKTRIYGMWFTDYHPYFLLAKAFYHEGSYGCAVNALDLSFKQEDLSGSAQEKQERERIKKDLEEIPLAGR